MQNITTERYSIYLSVVVFENYGNYEKFGNYGRTIYTLSVIIRFFRV